MSMKPIEKPPISFTVSKSQVDFQEGADHEVASLAVKNIISSTILIKMLTNCQTKLFTITPAFMKLGPLEEKQFMVAFNPEFMTEAAAFKIKVQCAVLGILEESFTMEQLRNYQKGLLSFEVKTININVTANSSKQIPLTNKDPQKIEIASGSKSNVRSDFITPMKSNDEKPNIVKEDGKVEQLRDSDIFRSVLQQDKKVEPQAKEIILESNNEQSVNFQEKCNVLEDKNLKLEEECKHLKEEAQSKLKDIMAVKKEKELLLLENNRLKDVITLNQDKAKSLIQPQEASSSSSLNTYIIWAVLILLAYLYGKYSRAKPTTL